eukprot:2421752-Heterocapsa_arctica.AAC.1
MNLYKPIHNIYTPISNLFAAREPQGSRKGVVRLGGLGEGRAVRGRKRKGRKRWRREHTHTCSYGRDNTTARCCGRASMPQGGTLK